MSYCVNCGVELHESEKKCPLCDTVVINPNLVTGESADGVFPQEQKLVDTYQEKSWYAKIITIILAIPASICLLCNFGINGKITWSLIVTAALFMIWCFIVPPLIIKRARRFPMIAIDTCAILLFLYVIRISVDTNNASGKDWYWGIAFPIVIAVMVFLGINAAFINNKISKLYIAAVFFLTIGTLVVAIEVITDLFKLGEIKLQWSLIALAPCALLALLYLIIKKKKNLKSSLLRRLRM